MFCASARRFGWKRDGVVTGSAIAHKLKVGKCYAATLLVLTSSKAAGVEGQRCTSANIHLRTMASSAGSGSKRRSVHSLCTRTNHPHTSRAAPCQTASHGLQPCSSHTSCRHHSVLCGAQGCSQLRRTWPRCGTTPERARGLDCLPFLNQPSTMPHASITGSSLSNGRRRCQSQPLAPRLC